MENNKKENAKTKNIEELEKQLLKANILIKMQRKMLKQFMLHDDAGTAYMYLGPNPEDLEDVSKTKANLENSTGIQKYDYILENLHEIQVLLENMEVDKEVLSAIEVIQNKYLDLYIEEKEKRSEE